jgi:hypothetical protein
MFFVPRSVAADTRQTPEAGIFGRLMFRTACAIGVVVFLLLASVMWGRFSAAYGGHLVDPRIAQLPGRPDRLHSGLELVEIFVGNSGCAASTSTQIPGAMATIAASLGTQMIKKGGYVTRRGVALDGQPADGLRFLNRVGTFDEIDLGHNWLNAEAVNYIWRDVPGKAALPQIILVEHHVQVTPSAITIGPDRVVARKIGMHAIVEWARAGAPLPTE